MPHTTLGLKTSATMELRNDGKLIYACRQPTPKIMNGYEAHRVDWLTNYRDRYAPKSYREGRYNLISLLFHPITKYIWR